MNPLIPMEYVVLVAIMVLMAVAWVSWHSTRRAPDGWRVAVTACRILAVGGVLLLLLDLGHRQDRIQTLDASWAIMLDESASMRFVDGDTGSRFQAARQIVKEAFEQSKDPKKIKLYGFSGTVAERDAGALAQQTPDGDDTQIVESGLNLLLREKTRGSKLLGILLLSDGRQPAPRSPEPLALRAAAQNIPIFPVVLGGPVPSKDLALKFSRRRFVSFAGQPFAFRGEVVNHRMGPVSAEIFLRDGAGKTLDQTRLLVRENERSPFQFNLTLDKPGYYEYILETPLRQGESDRANNSMGLGAFVLSERLNVMMLEGEPYWDTKFLSHLLRAQTNISMTAVFRVAEDKF
ncbi:MAG: vWA domain-containing protein, partial [Desulfobacteraceae bacterium]